LEKIPNRIPQRYPAGLSAVQVVFLRGHRAAAACDGAYWKGILRRTAADRTEADSRKSSPKPSTSVYQRMLYALIAEERAEQRLAAGGAQRFIHPEPDALPAGDLS
jgi:hypothetical protein